MACSLSVGIWEILVILKCVGQLKVDICQVQNEKGVLLKHTDTVPGS